MSNSELQAELTPLEARLRKLAGEEGEWVPILSSRLAAAPDPERAGRLVVDLLERLSHEHLRRATAARPETLARVLYALCGVAPFFAPFLKRHPGDLVSLLEEDLSSPRQRGEGEAALEAAFEADAGADPALLLRRLKYYELARITVRDCCDEWVPLQESGGTLSQLSQLADVLLDRALRVAEERIAKRYGSPRWIGEEGEEIELGFCILGLGKLGSEELNFSSDVDLVYVFEKSPSPLRAEAEKGPPSVYFARLAQEFGSLVAAATGEGFLYRVDLELRPEGTKGTLVVSDERVVNYFEGWADTWEKAAFMKARPVAGDLELGWRTIRRLDPLIYRSTMDYAAVNAIRSLKNRVEEVHGRDDAGFSVKLGSGGIRDVEFVAQALQLLHGARIPQLRSRSTQTALADLARVGLLPTERSEKLLEDYRFLRRIENRLQMEAERQVHRVPKDHRALTRLARAMGYRGPEAARDFEEALTTHRERILELFRSVVSDEGLSRIFELFARNVPHLLSFGPSRKMTEALVEAFGRAIEACSNPGRALNNLDRFIHGVGRRRFYYELLLDRPELVPRLVQLFAASKYLSNYLTSHPRLIEPVFEDPDLLLPSRRQLREHLEEIRETLEDQADLVEARLDALRLFHHRETINVGLLEIAGKIDRQSAEQNLTEVAELCLEEALDCATHALAAVPRGVSAAVRNSRFIVVAMGKLASRELSYGSDLDLVFLFDTEGADQGRLLEAQEHFVRLAQRVISILQTPTSQGTCYDIDTRLRPSGNQGMLVTSLASFERYHAESALAWERQALLRARPAAGDLALAQAFERLRLTILKSGALPGDLALELRRIRQRMEKELARETHQRRNWKTGRGGTLDVESIVEYLRLIHGSAHPELLAVDRLEIHLARLQELGLLEPEKTRRLREGWDFLQQLGNRLRIVENRSISDLDAERGDLDGVARSLGYVSAGREAGAQRALLNDYQRHTDLIRSIYVETLGVGD